MTKLMIITLQFHKSLAATIKLQFYHPSFLIPLCARVQLCPSLLCPPTPQSILELFKSPTWVPREPVASYEDWYSRGTICHHKIRETRPLK